MSNRKKSHQRKNTKKVNNKPRTSVRELFIWVILIVLALYIGYIGYDKNLKFKSTSQNVEDTIKHVNKKNIETTGIPQVIKDLNGDWNNNSDGSTITFTNNLYSIDFPSVDGGTKINGAFKINEDTLFMTTNSNSKTCAFENGVYLFAIKNKKLNTKLIKDNCIKRKTRMLSGWNR
ncbi:MAG: hypothetical protein ACEPOW_12350 [Bacteroidales bacterium]